MKSWYEIVLEAMMSQKDAMNIFGITQVPDQKELNFQYKNLAKKNHPDLGGSSEKMKQINVAYEILKKMNPRQSDIGNTETRYKNESAPIIVMNMIEKTLNLEKFRKHFESIFKKSFTIEKLEKHLGKHSHHVNLNCEFVADGRETVIYLSVTADFLDLMYKLLLPGDEKLINMYIFTEIYHNKRKIKLTQKSWNVKDDAKTLSDPEVLFPVKKFEDKIKKKAENRKVTKKDFIASFTRELKADHQRSSGNGDIVEIPFPKVNNKTMTYLYRMTIYGMGSWSFHEKVLDKMEKEFVTLNSAMFFETEKTLDFMMKFLKEAQTKTSIIEIGRIINNAISEYKKFVESPEFDLEDNKLRRAGGW